MMIVGKDFEEDDPMEIIGMDMGASEETMIEMARVFIDEYMRMGYPDAAVMRIFRDPFYRAPHSVLHGKGEAFVAEMIAAVRAERQAH